ncbi:MAG: AAA family ATPase [Thermomicrobiales bacterium]|nr:AAA family ATPase [Thermomicrobiales bacterium]
MILIELRIQDYKQFAGEHVFAPASEGVVAVIGQNGAGKTTLFEAIEWCLYQPREIQLDEVAPRGRVAKPRVQLTLMDPHTGERYVIVRSLSRSRVTDAEIYREEDLDNRIVKGSRQVTDYVARTLIGLSHRAFVSTFFTRQKELTFFGDLKETERRREVGRLLGMETIREAQKLIGDDRNDAQTQAKVFEIQGREAAADRDFVAEGAEAEQRIAAASAQLATATDSLAQAEASFVAIRADVERLTSLEREHARLSAALERIEGDIRAQQASRDAAVGELARMDAAAAERASLATVAAGLETHRATAQGHDLARERHLQAQR